jgi:hypothetical protein
LQHRPRNYREAGLRACRVKVSAQAGTTRDGFADVAADPQAVAPLDTDGAAGGNALNSRHKRWGIAWRERKRRAKNKRFWATQRRMAEIMRAPIKVPA